MIKYVPYQFYQSLVASSGYSGFFHHIHTTSQENLSSGFADTVKTQTGLLSYSNKLESWNFGLSKYRYYTT